MPTYQRFEDLPVWQSAAQLYEQCDNFLSHAPANMSRSFRDQLERAVLSVFNNIARGSAGEVRSMLVLLSRRPWLTENLKSEISNLKLLAESCSRQIRAWADHLQNGSIQGQRHLTEKSRSNFQSRRRAEKFTSQIKEAFRRDHPELFRSGDSSPSEH